MLSFLDLQQVLIVFIASSAFPSSAPIRKTPCSFPKNKPWPLSLVAEKLFFDKPNRTHEQIYHYLKPVMPHSHFDLSLK